MMKHKLKANKFLTSFSILLCLCIFTVYYVRSNFSFALIPNTSATLPNLVEGDLVVITKQNIIDFQYGDLYAFKAPGGDIYVM